MNRLGFNSEDIGEMVHILQNNASIIVASVFSHLSSAEDEGQDEFTRRQVQIFLDAADKIQGKPPTDCLKHIANSAAMIRFPEYHFDMVRLGIGIYGYDTTGRLSNRLRSISTLKTEISQIKHLHHGDTVGYGRRGEIKKESTIATIAIGYADGFFRAFGNGKTTVWINGHPAPVIGNVCMDMTMIDITGIEAREGDEVIIFDDIQSLQSLADSIHTIPYEILTNISERVKRIYISE
jgi:alanine racemase